MKRRKSFRMTRRDILNACRHRGEKICKSYRTKSTGGFETIYLLEPSGRKLPEGAALAALSSEKFRPLGDALFEGASSQTFAWAD